MKAPPEYCPKCDGIREVDISLGLAHRPYAASTTEADLVIHLHCRSCLTYLKTISFCDLGSAPVQSYRVGYRAPKKERILQDYATPLSR